MTACAAGLALLPRRAGAEETDAEPDVLSLEEEVPDFAPVRAWNGLGRFVELARGLGLAVEFVSLDHLTFDPSLNLILVYPDRAPDGVALRDFVAAGGRLLVADDYGLGASALAPLGMTRVAGPTAPSVAFRGNPDLPVAVPKGPHPALEGVGAVVANHPAAFGAGPGGRCLLAFFAPPPACLLAEVDLGYGVALALADPSVLIDLMLQVEGNRRLAEGLLRYLTVNRRAQITLALPPEAWAVVRPAEPGGTGAAAAVRRWLARVSEPLAAAPPWFWLLVGDTALLLAVSSRIRIPAREDLARPRLLHAERSGPSTTYPSPATPEAWSSFAQDALDLMHGALSRKLAEAEERANAARRGGAGLRRRLRLGFAQLRLSSLQRRLRAAGDEGSGGPSLERMRRLAEDFLRTER